MWKMKCPLKRITMRPSMCLTCEYCGGLINGGVLCFKANRRLEYDLLKRVDLERREP